MTTRQDSHGGLSELSVLMSGEHRPVIDPEYEARRRRARRRGALAAMIVLLLVLGAAGTYVGWALTAPVAAPLVTSQVPAVPEQSAAAIAMPEGVAAVSVSGADEYLGTEASGTWATSGDDDPHPIASITKLITALVILDAMPLAGADDAGPTITFSEADEDLYDKYYVMGATIARMPVGSTMSQRDALATMLIPSASNYAEALSTWAFGSQGAFVGAARRWLADHGLTGTTIVEPTGINPRNTSTRTDLMAIARIAAADPTIATIAATRSLSLPGPGAVYTTNDLLGTLGVTGLKTGNLGEGSHNLLLTASLDVGLAQPLAVTGVFLGGYSHQTVNGSAVALLESIRAGFHRVPLAETGQDVGSFSTPWGSTARMVIGEDASIFTWSDTPITASMETMTPTTYADGEVIGTITWSAGPNTATAPVRIAGTIEPPAEWWRLTHPGELGDR